MTNFREGIREKPETGPMAMKYTAKLTDTVWTFFALTGLVKFI